MTSKFNKIKIYSHKKYCASANQLKTAAEVDDSNLDTKKFAAVVMDGNKGIYLLLFNVKGCLNPMEHLERNPIENIRRERTAEPFRGCILLSERRNRKIK